MANKKTKEEVKIKDSAEMPSAPPDRTRPHLFPPNVVGPLADEIARTLLQRLPSMSSMMPRRTKPTTKKKMVDMDQAIFLDTSAIIDGRIFDVIELGLLSDIYVVPESILSELKHIADSQDVVKRERGKKGLDRLNNLKKKKGVKVTILPDPEKLPKNVKSNEIDEKLLQLAKTHKARLVTCDFNLEKKASIQGVKAININQLANLLKITAVPGESLHIHLQHVGKDPTQGVGYLDDGTMVVVEKSSAEVEKNVDVVVSRVIQTSSGRILFAKKI